MDARSRLSQAPSLLADDDEDYDRQDDSVGTVKRTVKFTLRLSEKERREIKRAAEEKGQGLSSYIRLAVSSFMDRPG